jgi:hypothetical protein
MIVLTALGLKIDPLHGWRDSINNYDAFYVDNDDGAINPSTGYPTGLYMPLIGNGYLSHAKGVRSDTMHISGLFNNETTSPSHRAAIPATFAVSVKNSNTMGVIMDIKRGSYHRRGMVSGTHVQYELKWYAHRTFRSLYVLGLELTNYLGEDAKVEIENSVPFASNDIVFKGRQKVFGDDSSVTTICGRTTIAETSDGLTHTLCITADTVPEIVTITAAQKSVSMTFISAYRTSLDLDESLVEEAAMTDYKSGREVADAGKLYTAHVDGWAKLWESGIEIEGRPDVAIAVNASLYAILSSTRDDWAYGLAPGGLTNYYNGHSFWDTETWMYPPLLLLQPSIARSLMQYRFYRLEGARLKAQSYSPPWAGTMFPWESAYSGVETCPTFAATGLREDHISGDIAIAIWQYYSVTQDQDWLRTVGVPMLEGIAQFWSSRSVYQVNADGITQSAHILDIIPPDEYVDHVNDSVYSNFVAAQALRYYVSAVSLLNITCEACNKYSQLANDLAILVDETQGIHPEYQGYPGNVVKQADVVLLHYPLGMQMTEEMQKADLEYYSTRTDTHGPAMTWGMHSIGYLDLKEYDQASKFFNMSFQDNLQAPLQVWTETPDGNAVNFITGAGGFLQTMLFGYPGIRISASGDELAYNPQCPEAAVSIKIRGVHYLDSVFDLQYACNANDKVVKNTIRMVKQGKVPVSITRRPKLSNELMARARIASIVDILNLNEVLEVESDGSTTEFLFRAVDVNKK